MAGDAILLVLGVASTAFCVWLIVRIVNRRERWAIWTAVWLGELIGFFTALHSLIWYAWLTATPLPPRDLGLAEVCAYFSLGVLAVFGCALLVTFVIWVRQVNCAVNLPNLSRQSPFPGNAPGPFYVENGNCISCEAPFHEAPDLMGTDDGSGGYHCHFRRQPTSPEEIELAVMACCVSCTQAVRYGGDDPAILARFKELGQAGSCDALMHAPSPFALGARCIINSTKGSLL